MKGSFSVISDVVDNLGAMEDWCAVTLLEGTCTTMSRNMSTTLKEALFDILLYTEDNARSELV
jgi:hypothetical protein